MTAQTYLEAFGSCAVIAAGQLCMKLAINRHGPLFLWKRPMFILGLLFACSGQVVSLLALANLPTFPFGGVALVFDIAMSPFILGTEWKDLILGLIGLVGSGLIAFFGHKAVPNALVPMDWVGLSALGLVATLVVLSGLYAYAYSGPYGPCVFAASLIAVGSAWVDRYQAQEKQHKGYVVLFGLIFYIPAAIALSETFARQRGLHAGRAFYFVWAGLQSSLCAILCASFHKSAKDDMVSLIGLFVSAAVLALCPLLPLPSSAASKPEKKARRPQSTSSEEAESLMEK